ncbi:hypothetical protein HYDPIDRAFT_34999 [Hydnomerulius pinastri MD-312]|uniref:Uncharacterized protein n=1 Tax=Hydnomerulius pinastri MD-312 TaxID=994086 RepID=A0A0C2PGB5_9AGAM|nr:hypothetical protein HYDPIDRAFT_34999 [Hydnomerulius pinastri MD-312]
MKLQPTHSDTLPARYLPYRRYPDSYPCLSRVPLERSFAVVLDPTPGSDNNLPADPLPAPSDEGSPMRSIRDTPSVRRTPSMDSENSVRGYLMEGVESVEPMASAHTSYVQVTNSGHAASADRLEELTAAHIHRLTADVQRTIHRADYVKRRLAHQYDRVDQALSDEIEYRVNRAVRLALKDIKDRVDVLDGHNSPRAQNNQDGFSTCPPGYISLRFPGCVAQFPGRA